ncbi:hypothetical protein K1T71_010164 [Dendrolimus kikuchii]|uniref:Uncharacterized protein n=1 Tax=Dendrolimus kikuchii TaxID=765133 RepID=A0ACC1CQT5_9NEOP|nr:hypothetical protein K1T71_010164 [Dendrolimus kikuchii]
MFCQITVRQVYHTNMKFFAVFAAILAVACGYQATWTLDQLSSALQNPNTDPALIPHLEHALDELMQQIWSGQPVTPVLVTIPAIDFSTWGLHELSEAIQNPETDPAIMPYLVEALNQMMLAIHQGQVLPVASVVAPAMDVTLWTLQELSDALVDPQTHPALIPYLENALNEMMSALMGGNAMESIVVATPVGLLPVVPEVIPEQVAEPIPAPVEEVVVPSAPASPLVQVIINVNAQAIGASPSPAVTPEIVADKPEPVIVVDQAPEPVIVVDQAAIEPIIVGHPVIPEPVVVPSPVIVSPEFTERALPFFDINSKNGRSTYSYNQRTFRRDYRQNHQAWNQEGKQVVPTGATIEDVDNGITEEIMEQKYKDLFITISEVEKSGDLTPRSKNEGTWDPKLTPVLVLVRPNP